MLNYIIWDWDPAILTIFGREIRYYGLLFAGGIAIGYYLLKGIFAKEGSKLEWLDSMLMYVIVGTVLGARLGHCLFYEADYYLKHPIEIIKIWEGGLASHGGAIGIIIALWLYANKVTKKPMLWGLDRLLLVAGIAAGMIRLGNLANSEIYGHATGSESGFVHIHDSYFGRYITDEDLGRYIEDYSFIKDENSESPSATLVIEFNRYVRNEQDARSLGEFRIKPLLKYREGADGSAPNLYTEKENDNITYHKKGGHFFAEIPVTVIPKHPTHIYEASFYFLTFIILFLIYKRGGLQRLGLITGVFFIMVFGSRFFIEIIKENQVATEVGKVLNNGQKLSIPFILAGIGCVIYSYLPQKKTDND